MLRAESFIIDGEAVYRDPSTGKVDFQPCQRRCSTQDIGAQMFLRQKYPLKFMAFDILLLNQQWLIDRPLLERKSVLWQLLPRGSNAVTLEYVPHRYDLRVFFEEVKARGDEGLIIKRADSKYRQGERSYNWQKVKNWREEVCRVVGYTPGKNARSPFFGALVLEKDGKFRGCVGSGFNEWELRKLKDLFTSAPKIPPSFSIGEPYIAVDVDLKVEVQYFKQTPDGVLRFPVFKGIVP
jgi:bifunctional non-homologous end joining protein LigD